MHPLQLHITSLRGAAEGGEAEDATVTRSTASLLHSGCGISSWDAFRHEEHYLEVWPREELVYLSAESETVLTTLEPGKTYVVGGLVDHNRCKGLTYGLAKAAGIATARLPITKYVPLQSCTMLAVNHVFQILLEFEQHEGSDEERWAAAMETVIPLRKRQGWKRRGLGVGVCTATILSTQQPHQEEEGEEEEEEEEEEEKEEEESLFKADVVNEEDPERDRATQV